MSTVRQSASPPTADRGTLCYKPEGMAPDEPSSLPLRRPLAAYGAVAAATVLLARLPQTGLPYATDAMHLGIAAVLLLGALRFAEPLGGARALGFSLGGLLQAPESDPGLLATLRAGLPTALRELGYVLRLCLLIFPPFVVGFVWWHGPSHPFRWNPPPDLASFALAQLVVVAIPEEAFFRGYLQGALARVWPRRVPVLGVQVPWRALLVQALLFGVLHFLVTPDPQRLAVAFPGLLFGWLKCRRGGIGAAVLMHALSNVLAELLVRGYLH